MPEARESTKVASTIGIKIANGEFYPLVDENSQIKKRLILTTVHDKQRSVQINLYKSQSGTMEESTYIGSLVIEKIKARPKGEPSIEMIIGSTADGEINAEAIDIDSGPNGEHQFLSVSLKSLDESNIDYDLPGFDLDMNAEPPPSGLYEKTGKRKSDKSSSTPILIAAMAAGLLVIIAALCYFLFFVKGIGGKTPQITAEEQTQIVSTEQPQVLTPIERTTIQDPAVVQTTQQPPIIVAPREPVVQAPVVRARPVPPVASYNVPAVIPREGVAYRIRWGDTLWDISEAFYRNPWLYPRIARFNNIRNPDLIISGRTIRIPPR
jgi:hypothetical protein